MSTFNTGCAHYCQLIEFIFEHNQLHVIMSFFSSPEPTVRRLPVVRPSSSSSINDSCQNFVHLIVFLLVTGCKGWHEEDEGGC